MFIKSLKNVSFLFFSPLPFIPVHLSSHVVSWIVLRPLKIESLICLGFPCTDTVVPRT